MCWIVLAMGEFLLYRVDMKRAPHPMAVPVPTSPSEPSLVVILGVDRGDHDYASLRDCIRKVDRWMGSSFQVVSPISERLDEEEEESRENGSVER